MSRHADLAAQSGVKVCIWPPPRSAWQPDTCENTNRLLRQYMPKGTDSRLFG